jgi:hypothetical protein
VEQLTWAIRGGTIPAVWTVNGISIELDDGTQVQSDIGVGDTVRVATETKADGGLLANSIEAVEGGSAEASGSTADVIVGIVEDMRPPVTIEGVRLDEGDAAVELYYTYGLALAESNQCGMAVEVAKAILLSVQEDETARFNAEEALRLCGELETTPTPEVTATPEA